MELREFFSLRTRNYFHNKQPRQENLGAAGKAGRPLYQTESAQGGREDGARYLVTESQPVTFIEGACIQCLPKSAGLLRAES